MEVGRACKARIVEFHVGVELLVGGLEILWIVFPALKHGVGAEVGEVGIVDLAVAQAVIVEDFELRLVGFGYVGEVFVVVCVDAFGVRFIGPVAEVVPGLCWNEVHQSYGEESLPRRAR